VTATYTPTAAAASHPSDTVHLSSEAARMYHPLVHDYGSGRKVDTFNNGSGNHKRSFAWPIAQDMNAALDRGDVHEFDKLNKNLQLYRAGAHGYAAASNGRHGTGDKYYDDNSWIGLAQMQAYHKTGNKAYLKDAQSTFDFVKTGEHDGGMKWKQGGSNQWMTCSDAPAAELALQLHAAPGNTPHQSHEYLGFAQRMNNNLDTHMRQPDGLYRNSASPHDPHGADPKDRAIWSYNQGSAIGMKVQLYKATGKSQYLQQAQQTAHASLGHFAKNNRYDKQGNAFNAIFFRNLEQLNGVAPDPKIQSALDQVGQNVWHQRNPHTNLADRTGSTSLLNQAGASQILSLMAMPPSQYSSLT
jgi:uncharacterized protein YyaL (SSP411 family)